MRRQIYAMFTLRGQYAPKNLDSSEHISLGGPNGVRAYPTSEGSGDIGYIARAELRWLIPIKKKPDQSLYLTTFFDNSGVKIVNNHGGDGVGYSGRYGNHCVLSGAGIGLIWSRHDDWYLQLQYAWPIGGENVQTDPSHHHGHFWIGGGIYF